MTTLFLAWQDTGVSRSWYPIGRLDVDTDRDWYRFGYLRGALKAVKEAKLHPLAAFPDLRRKYESRELFPLFRNRVLDREREDFGEYLSLLDLKPDQADPLEILAISGGRRQTDNLEVFPKVTRSPEGGFRCRFFVHGWRHVSESAQNALMQLMPGDELKMAIELNNPATGLALQLQTSVDYHMVGWTPRYLVIDLVKSIQSSFQAIRATVVKVNPVSAPSQQRVLVELTGNWPENYDPMSSEDFQDINA